jgi:hypothetical protein
MAYPPVKVVAGSRGEVRGAIPVIPLQSADQGVTRLDLGVLAASRSVVSPGIVLPVTDLEPRLACQNIPWGQVTSPELMFTEVFNTNHLVVYDRGQGEGRTFDPVFEAEPGAGEAAQSWLMIGQLTRKPLAPKGAPSGAVIRPWSARPATSPRSS